MSTQATREQAALTLEVSSDGVAWIVFDRPGSRVNLLSAEVLAHLDALLEVIEAHVREGSVRAVVVRSGKPGTFIAGADVNEIADVRDAAAGEAASREGQRVFRRLEQLGVPTVAAVDGICLGGGTELILACGRRIASDRAETKIGLPEVRLGIIPGFGGTVRLPRLIGLKEALGMILTGKPVAARKAERIGLVEEAVPVSLLYERAATVALEEDDAAASHRAGRPLANRLLDDTFPGRLIVLSQARQQVTKETRGHYPAPLAALDTIGEGITAPLERAFALEAEALGRLITSPVSRNLVRVFRLMEGAKKAPAAAQPHAIARAGVLGAGVMGGGIAQLLATRDIQVRLKDIRTDALQSGLHHAQALFDSAVERRRMKRREAVRRMTAIGPTLDYSGFGAVDIVIEAVVERMDVKRSVLREVEARVPESCVITSNTSSLSISEMQQALARPENFCGLHFFNPVHRMPLVEVIRGEATSDATLATTFALARRLDKTPLVVSDGPGFLVNRILAPYLNEAGWLLSDGASVKAIDDALLDFGMPMGPLRLLDEVGWDVALHAAATMHEAFGERMAPSPALARLDGTELLGRKGGRGFYVYDGDKEQGINEDIYERLGDGVPHARRDIPAQAIRERAVMAMVNEAARALEDNIVENAGAVDLGMITGTGFPPFRGGLLRYADSLGPGTVLARLSALQDEVGVRFEPARLIHELAAAGRGFYD